MACDTLIDASSKIPPSRGMRDRHQYYLCVPFLCGRAPWSATWLRQHTSARVQTRSQNMLALSRHRHGMIRIWPNEEHMQALAFALVIVLNPD